MAENKLKEFRERMGYTQQQLADKLDTTRSTISNYELGRREPDGAFYAKLQERFNVNDQAIGEIVIDIAKKSASTNG